MSFTSRYEVEDEYGTPPGCQSPSILNHEPDNSGEKTVGVPPSSPPTVCGTTLRPNRIGPNGDIELGSAKDPPATGGWVSNWASQFKSPLGEFSTPLHLLVVRADAPQMLCNRALSDLILLMPLHLVEDTRWPLPTLSCCNITPARGRTYCHIFNLFHRNCYVEGEGERVKPFLISSTCPSFMFSFATLPSAS